MKKEKIIQKRKIWTMGNFPFAVGGSPHQPIITEVEIIDEKNVGKGLKAFSFKTPSGTIRICESVTGGIVGDSFESVISDVKQTTQKIVDEQIKDAKNILKGSCKHYSPEEFFKFYKY